MIRSHSHKKQQEATRSTQNNILNGIKTRPSTRISFRLKVKGNNNNDSIDSDAIEAERKAVLMKNKHRTDQAKHENTLKTVNKDLKEAFARISSGNLGLTIKHLYALLLSKGAAPPQKARKATFEQLWKQYESTPQWERTVHFTTDDKKKLDEIKKLSLFESDD